MNFKINTAQNRGKIFFLLFGVMFFLNVTLAYAQTTLTAEQRCAQFKAQFVTSKTGNAVETLPYYCTAGGLITNVINIALIFAGIVTSLFIIIGGFWYLTSAGNEEQAEKGRKTLINAVIGLVLIIISGVIVRVVADTLTLGGGSSTTPTQSTTGTTPANSQTAGSTAAVSNTVSIQKISSDNSIVASVNVAQGDIAAIQKLCGGSSMNNASLSVKLNGKVIAGPTVLTSRGGTSYDASITIQASELLGQTGVLEADICDQKVQQINY